MKTQELPHSDRMLRSHVNWFENIETHVKGLQFTTYDKQGNSTVWYAYTSTHNTSWGDIDYYLILVPSTVEESRCHLFMDTGGPIERASASNGCLAFMVDGKRYYLDWWRGEFRDEFA